MPCARHPPRSRRTRPSQSTRIGCVRITTAATAVTTRVLPARAKSPGPRLSCRGRARHALRPPPTTITSNTSISIHPHRLRAHHDGGHGGDYARASCTRQVTRPAAFLPRARKACLAPATHHDHVEHVHHTFARSPGRTPPALPESQRGAPGNARPRHPADHDLRAKCLPCKPSARGMKPAETFSHFRPATRSRARRDRNSGAGRARAEGRTGPGLPGPFSLADAAWPADTRTRACRRCAGEDARHDGWWRDLAPGGHRNRGNPG